MFSALTDDSGLGGTLLKSKVLLYSMLILHLIIFSLLLLPLFAASHGVDLAKGFSLTTVSWLIFIIGGIGIATILFFTRTFWDPRPLLFVSLLIFNGGQYIAHLFEPNTIMFLGWFTDQQILAAGYFGLTSLSAWLVGFLLSLIFGWSVKVQADALGISRLRLIAIGFILIGTIPTILETIRAVKIVASQGYIGLYQQEVLTSTENISGFLSAFFIPGLLILLGSKTLVFRSRLVVITVISALFIVRILLGNRSVALLPLISTLFVWHYAVRPISRKLIASVLAVLFLVILPAVAILRQERGLVDFDGVANAVSRTNPFLASLWEFGVTASTTAYAMILIPSIRPFEYGLSYIYSIFTLLPSLGGLNPAIARGTLSDWLIQTVDPLTAANGGGLGYSAVAEVYTNFGLLGGVFGFILISFAIHLIFRKFSDYTNPIHIAVSGVLLSVLLFWPRAEAVNSVRGIIWFALIPAVITFLRWKKSN